MPKWMTKLLRCLPVLRFPGVSASTVRNDLARAVLEQANALAEAEAFRVRATAPGRFVPLPPAENLFGKTRGRFDEAAARASDRMLPERAIGVIVPMPPAEFDAFVRLFNDVFGRDGRPRRFEIREIGRG